MKKIIFILFLFLFFNYSCSKDSTFEVNESSISNNTLIKIRDFDTFESRRNAFNTLTNEEKVNFWIARLDKYVEENKLNSEQIFAINNIKNMIKPDYYVYDSPQNIGFDLIIMDEMIDYLKNKFSDLQIYNMLFEINTQLDIIDANDKNNLPSKTLSVCNCAINSRYTCGRVNQLQIVGIGIEYGECSNPSCVNDGGCGGFWTQTCTGSKCSY